MFEPLPGRRGYSRPRIAARQVQAAILGHVAAAGWTAAARPRAIAEPRTKIRETPDFAVGRQKYKMDLIPPALAEAKSGRSYVQCPPRTLAPREEDAGERDARTEGTPRG